MLQYEDVCSIIGSTLTSHDALNQLKSSLLELDKLQLPNIRAENQLNLIASKSEFTTFVKKNDKQNVETDRLIMNDQYLAKKTESNYVVLIFDSNFYFNLKKN